MASALQFMVFSGQKGFALNSQKGASRGQCQMMEGKKKKKVDEMLLDIFSPDR